MTTMYSNIKQEMATTSTGKITKIKLTNSLTFVHMFIILHCFHWVSKQLCLLTNRFPYNLALIFIHVKQWTMKHLYLTDNLFTSARVRHHQEYVSVTQ